MITGARTMIGPVQKDTSGAGFAWFAAESAVFDDDNLLSPAGPVPVMRPAEQTSLVEVAPHIP